MEQTTTPEFQQETFRCPQCGIVAVQSWAQALERFYSEYYEVKDLWTCNCAHCKKRSFWYQGDMIYPTKSLAPTSHPDMPLDIIDDYNEAASIFNNSPRGAAALLRLALQKLMKSLGESGNHIDSDIKSLVQKGLPVEIQQALDILRVIGNESVHPGSIDMKDNREVALKLFDLINFIIQNRITQPKEINQLFASLPAGKLDAIAKRDGVSK
ncbi:DUF4145 domain-containing protein [Bacillus wiedmannii]|uniref:DUF4145 domain-containing protein n=1 Tax=Bacillus wiedmannii TaxID=1890302 RepID=UPI0007CB6867|nr:DUF4145 domain-containing protein [Bacillus wiedmannii]OAK36281.1 hypothetical protein A6284_26220 [Bacillus wiedmannii]HDR7641226.1 DUF4145 domain-containing protein [Bacillus wiedmannii]